jgi:hypothetical protein
VFVAKPPQGKAYGVEEQVVAVVFTVYMLFIVKVIFTTESQPFVVE